MTLDERQLAVALILSLTLGVRLLAHREAGGMLRDQSDGFALEGRVKAHLFRLLTLGGGLGAILAWMVDVPLPGTYVLPTWALWGAVIGAEAGVILLVWVHIALGVHFSGTLHLRSDHHLVRSGPYARVRHPMYTSFLLILGGISALIGNVFLGALLMGSQVWVLAVRLKIEEGQLAERFGPEWEAHRLSTGRLFPRLG